jgi:photosystem II stability/assembly factor-like uncharacterized protein
LQTRAGRIVMRMLAAVLTGLLLLPACSPRRAPLRWRAVSVPTDANFTGLWFADSLNGWVTGGGWAIEGGLVGRTRDGGRTWRFQSGAMGRDGKGGGLGRVQFRDWLHGCATATGGRIVVTDDGGENWRPATVSGSGGGNVFDLQFLDARNGWASGTSILRTEDGGESWSTLRRSSENGDVTVNAIHFVDGVRGWLVGHSGVLMRSDDGGTNWQPVPLPLRAGERPILRDITFSDSTHGWIVGEQGCIFRTRDGGASWTLQEDGVPVVRVLRRGETRRRDVVPELETEPDRLALAAVQFADSLDGWAVGYYADVAESVVLHTADGGVTWGIEHVQEGEELRSLFVLDREHAWAAGDRARTKPQVILRYSRLAR